MFPELRQALRQLRKSPGFTATAVVTLGLGIGATTAIFTLVQQVMLKSLPVAKPGELEARLRAELHDWQASHVPDMVPQEKEVWQKQQLYLTPGGAGVDDMRQQYEDGLRLLFTLGIAVGTGVVFGIAPAWMTSHAEPVEALRGARGSTGTKARWPQKALVIAQAEMSLVLLSVAAPLAAVIPAQRAANLDPVEALRSE